MKDGRLSGSLAIMFPIFLIIALSLPLLFLFLFSVALIFEVVRMSRAAPPGPVSVLSVYRGLLPSRSPPLSA
jgi:cellulose synthase/poly-beta-1,6-N-acetylglucosamine synthase-like glycosyltransferase